MSSYLSAIGPIGMVVIYQLYQAKASEIDTTVFELQQQLATVNQDLQQKTQQLEVLYNDSDIIYEDEKKESKQRIAELRTTIDSLQRESSVKVQQYDELKSINDESDKLIKQFTVQVDDLKHQLKLSENDKNKLEMEYKFKLNSKIEELITAKDLKIEALSKTLQDLDSDKQLNLKLYQELVKKTEVEITKYENDLLDFKLNFDKKCKEVDDLHHDKELLIDKVQELSQVEQSYKALESYKHDIKTLESDLNLDDITHIKQKLTTLETSNNDKHKEIGKLSEDLQSHQRQLTDLTTELKEFKSKYHQLEKNVNDLEVDKQHWKNQYHDKCHDFELYDIVRCKVAELFNNIKQFVPDIDAIKIHEEAYKLDISHIIDRGNIEDKASKASKEVKQQEDDKTGDEGIEKEDVEDEKDEKEDEKEDKEDEKSVDKEVEPVAKQPGTVQNDKDQDEPKNIYINGNLETQRLLQIYEAFKIKFLEFEKSINVKQTEINGLNDKVASYADDIKQLKKDHQTQIQHNDKLVDELNLKTKSYDGTKKDYIQLKSDHDKLEQALATVTSENDDLKLVNDTLVKKNESLESARDIIDEKLITDKKVQSSLQQEIQLLTTQVEDYKHKFNASQQEHNKTKLALTTVQQELSDKLSIIDKLEEILSVKVSPKTPSSSHQPSSNNQSPPDISHESPSDDASSNSVQWSELE